MSIKELTTKYIQVRELRRKLEAKAKELKETTETQLQNLIFEEMAKLETTSIKLAGIGNVIRSERKHYEIRDKELFAHALCTALEEQVNLNKPLVDGMLAQMRVSKDVLNSYIERTHFTPELLGVLEVSTPELSIRKEQKS